jgi:undecaprenyl pyrophosphate phosphatase UppP
VQYSTIHLVKGKEFNIGSESYLLIMNDRTYRRQWLIWWILLISSIIAVVIGVFYPDPWQTLFFVVGAIILAIWLLFGFLYENRMVREYVSRRKADP